MDIQNTKKVITSILQDKVTAEDCRNALKELEALDQAEKDLTKTNAALSKERDTLQAENAKIKDKLKDADDKAIGIIQAAEVKANAILASVEDAVKDAQAKADKKLKETQGRIEAAEASEKYALEAARNAQAKLDAINAELEKSTAKFKALVA